MSKKLILAKDVVEKYNIPYPTLTHYTNLSFFTIVGRRGNRKLYDEEEIKVRLPQIHELVRQGYPLRLIRDNIINGAKPVKPVNWQTGAKK